MGESKRAIIIGASSDIGLALATNWLQEDWQLIGTYRTKSAPYIQLSKQFAASFACDMADPASIDTCATNIQAQQFAWDAVVMCPGTLEPIGRFDQCAIDQWEENLYINLSGQLRLLHKLLDTRNRSSKTILPLVLFFAGGGTNSAPLNYSAYTIAKIALIKAVELLDAEMPDMRFCILGPGWVKTKIHEQTLNAGNEASAGAAAQTQKRLETGEFVPMQQVIECCNWLVKAPKSSIGGRNFSAAHDFKHVALLEKALDSDANMFKLRRLGNDKLS